MAKWSDCAICGRAIPVGELCYGIKNWRGDPDGGDTICRDCLVPENAPTLTPPNEPLSINQLKDMKGKPVWLEFTEYDEDNEQVNYRGWALVSSEDVYKFSMFLILPEGDLDKFFEYEDYGKTWVCYRRPPEGEEDT